MRFLKQQLAKLRREVGDTGEDFPECEKVVQEFWDYDEADRARAVELSGAFLKVRHDFIQIERRGLLTGRKRLERCQELANVSLSRHQ